MSRGRKVFCVWASICRLPFRKVFFKCAGTSQGGGIEFTDGRSSVEGVPRRPAPQRSHTLWQSPRARGLWEQEELGLVQLSSIDKLSEKEVVPSH